MTDEQLASLFNSFTLIFAKLMIEVQTLQGLWIAQNPNGRPAFDLTRGMIQKDWQPLLDSLGQSTPESLIDMLQKFEGTVQ